MAVWDISCNGNIGQSEAMGYGRYGVAVIAGDGSCGPRTGVPESEPGK